MAQFNQMTELWIFVACPNRFEPLKSPSYLIYQNWAFLDLLGVILNDGVENL